MEMELEEYRYFGLCKCCLQDGCFRNMWAHQKDAVGQNYGEMLKKCFGLDWQKPDNEHLDQICDECIELTKTTYMFRVKILKSQDWLNGVQGKAVKAEDTTDTRETEEDIDVKTRHDETQVHVDEYKLEYLEDENANDYPSEVSDAELNSKDHDYVDVLLKQEEEVLLVVDDGNGYIAADEIQSDSSAQKEAKKSKKHRGTYKNYTMDDLKKSLEAAKSGAMSPAAAGQQYNVPRKTIAQKLLAEKRGIPQNPSADNSGYQALAKEVTTLLTFTNATPFKTRTAHYHCAYCSTAGPLDDGDALRTHTRTRHAGERTLSVEKFLRPLWLNEILKIDIENLNCIVCWTALTSWNNMFKHLKDTHDLDFDEAYKRVIPFILNRDLQCALCKQPFPNFQQLDSHMNEHYINYMCSECGDTFLSGSRLNKHVKIHKTGRFPCSECGKIYTLEKYRKKHIELVHRQDKNVRCLYCDEKFLGAYQRHLHVMEYHKEKVKYMTCELCGKTFDWRPYYLVHVQKKHKKEMKYKCSFCYAFFFMNSELVQHLTTHIGEK